MESRLIINDKTLGWFITFIVINNIIALSFNIDNLFYLFCSICLIFILYKSKTLHFNKGMILLYIACILSLLVNDTQIFFKPWDRLLSFILITTLVSAFIESNYIMRFRIRLFNSLLLIYQMIVIGSIITHFAGIHFYREEHYTGITKHSMLLAPVSAIIIIYCIYTLTSIKHISKFQKLYFSTLLIAAFLTLFLCASRTALISSIIAISIYLIIIYHHKIKSFIKISIVTLILLILSFPYWSSYLQNIEKKNEGSMSAGGMTSSRDELWITRIDEFNSNPLFGIGFSTIDISKKGSYFDISDGKIETGSSWLSILSMIGIVGFSCFLIIYLNCIKTALSLIKKYLHYASFLLALLIFWSLHMVAEGYIFASGSFLFFNFWLLLGYIHAIGRNHHFICVIKDRF